MLDFRDIKLPVKLKMFTKSKERTLLALVFLVMQIKKNIQYMYQMCKKTC